jgi:hypothetical protein
MSAVLHFVFFAETTSASVHPVQVVDVSFQLQGGMLYCGFPPAISRA